VYQAAVIEAQDEYDKGKIEFESEAAQQGADAQKDYATALNDLARIRDRKIADSEKVMALEIASAEKAYTLRIEVARTVHWKVSVQARFGGIRSVGLTATGLALERFSQFATDPTLGGLC
jgi:hypothetical protein